MTFRRLFFPAIIAVGGGIAAWIWFGRDGDHHGPSAKTEVAGHDHGPARGPQTPAIPQPKNASLTSSVEPGSPLVRTDSTPAFPITGEPAAAMAGRSEAQPEARADLEGVHFMLRDFRTRMKENPVGSNAEIMRAVMGGNPAGATLGPPAGQSLNSEGELVDRWETPYFFHQLSKTSMEIRSAGPDRQMWTADDLVAK
ncbi:MAG: hypothetical protein ABIZ81_17255 [Opitutaceae bacterium]